MGKFFKTLYTVTVLSEHDPLGEVSIEDIAHAINDGDHIGQVLESHTEELSSDEMRDALIEVGNDGSFFSSLNDEDEEESEVPTALEKGPGDDDDEAEPADDFQYDGDADDDLFTDLDGDEDITEDA
jgi:hypothetical protein